MAKNGAKARELLFGTHDEFVMESQADPLYNPYKYFNYLIGYNSRLDAIQAAILSLKLKYLDRYNDARRKIAAWYDEGLKDVVKVPIPVNDGVSGYHQYVVRTERKKELGTFLSQRGIGSGAFYPVPLHLQKAFDGLGYKEGDFPAAETLSRQTVCLPIFPELTQAEASLVIKAVRDFEKGV
jgi:dTDP-4-amino-4,6-dideoxygalactose transaminase